MKYKLNPGDGAFYGPKIDFHAIDSQKRTWQLSTIQLDFAMPERFELEYTDSDSKKKRPVMLHRVIYGSLERFMGVLLESTNANLPTWLSPIQVRIISFTDRNQKTAEEFLEKLKEKGIRADADFTSTTVNEKVRNAELMKIPYIITIGDKEEKSGNLAVRKNQKLNQISQKDFIDMIEKEVRERS